MAGQGQKRPYGHVGSNVRFARKRPSSGHLYSRNGRYGTSLPPPNVIPA
jgi:hypothetical protein